MKARESGMPDEKMWAQFFDPNTILDGLGICDLSGNIVDLGCGYGTFSLPAARKNKGMIYALDIEKDMIQAVQKKADEAGLSNYTRSKRILWWKGPTCLIIALNMLCSSMDILHAEYPLKILTEAKRILTTGGRVGAIHWNDDPTTPRGPSLDIRPRPEQCQEWIRATGFELIEPYLDFPPFHYGMVGQKL